MYPCKSVESAIEGISQVMGQVIAEKAKEILACLTDDERKKLINEDQPTRTAKVLCLAAVECKASDLLYNQFACEAILSDLRKVKSIKSKRGV